MKRRAFSLIELMMALAIGSIVLLVSIIALRGAGQALRDIKRTAAENAALRSGWMLAMNEVDFWHSHANPDLPYGKWFNSEGTGKRPFQARAWNDPARNPLGEPGRIEVQSPEAFYIGMALPAMIGQQVGLPDTIYSSTQKDPVTGLPAPDWKLLMFAAEGDDPLVNSIPYAGTSPTTFTEKCYTPFVLPAGWDPWHVFGDYAGIANGESWSLLPASEQKGNLAAGQQEAFRVLGHIGVGAYLPPGTPNLLARPVTNRSRANIGNAGKFYDWGEVPWSLAATAAGEAGRSDLHYMQGMPGTGLLMKCPPNTVLWDGKKMIFQQKGESGPYVNRFRNGAGSPMRQVLIDYEGANSTWFNTSSPMAPNAIFYPNRIQQISPTVWDADTLLDSFLADPIRMLYSDNIYSQADSREFLYSNQVLNWNLFGKDGMSGSYMSGRLTSSTQQVPLMPSDVELDDLRAPAGVPAIRTSILRLRLRGSDRSFSQIMVSSAEGDRQLHLGFSALGTTFRGARMHWGWKSCGSDPAAVSWQQSHPGMRIGDVR